MKASWWRWTLCLVLIGAYVLGQHLSAQQPRAVNQITQIQVEMDPVQQLLKVVLHSDLPLDYAERTLTKEDTGITDVYYLNLWNSRTLVKEGPSFAQTVDHPYVKRIRLSQYKTDPPIARLVFDITQPVQPNVRATLDGGLELTFAGLEATVTDSEPSDLGTSYPSASPLDVLMARKFESATVVLLHRKAKELELVLSPLLTPNGALTSDERTNTLIFRDTSENIGPLRKAVQVLDQPGAAHFYRWGCLHGTFEQVEGNQLRLRTEKGEQKLLVLAPTKSDELKKQLEQFHLGDSICVCWYDQFDRPHVRSITRVQCDGPAEATPDR